MTSEEYAECLQALSNSEFDKFKFELGTKWELGRTELVAEYAADQKDEERICFLLGIPTQRERRVAATMRAADAAVLSARSAKHAGIDSHDAKILATSANDISRIGHRLALFSIAISMFALLTSAVAVLLSISKR